MTALSRTAAAASLLALSLACASATPVEPPTVETPEPTTESHEGPAVRRVTEGCEPVEESRKYQDFVGDRALMILSWTGMSDLAADLTVPVSVMEIRDGAIAVRFLSFPMREQYIHIWLGSGHITAAEDGIFLVAPCSARIEPWPDPSQEPNAG